MQAKDTVCVKVYFKKDEFARVIGSAEASGFRRLGLLLYEEGVPNTKSLSKYLKATERYYVAHKQEREMEKAKKLAEMEKIKNELDEIA